MQRPSGLETIDYLAIGHLTIDISPQGESLGGSVAYAARTAQALGLRAGILTAWGEEIPTDALQGIQVVNVGAEHSTCFHNTYTGEGRRQQLLSLAPSLDYHLLPESWRQTPIVHLAPVAGEIPVHMIRYLDAELIGATPQGWMRQWDEQGAVSPDDWLEAEQVLSQVDAAVLSDEDLGHRTDRVEQLAQAARVLGLTRAAQGATVYAAGKQYDIPAPEVEEIDPTGSGDIFAAAFFTRLHFGDNPQDAGQFATQVATLSVQRRGLAGTPTQDELYTLMAEAL